MYNQKLILSLAILNGVFWIGLSGLLVLIFQHIAFLFVSVGMFLSFIIVDFFEEDDLNPKEVVK